MLFKKRQAKIGTRMYTMADSKIWVKYIIENRDEALFWSSDLVVRPRITQSDNRLFQKSERDWHLK